jgi:ubiquinone/menaquinone biosynthesis C-methylase UbiE
VPDAYYLSAKNAARYERDMGRFRDSVDDIPFYVELARQAAERGEAVLELGCGTGRVTIPMAQVGADVTGLDSSPAMLDIARAKAQQAGVAVTWVEGDMANFELGRMFGLVTIPFRSFLHLVTDEEHRECLAAIHRHLVPGGQVALNFYVPSSASTVGAHTSRVYRSMRLRDVSRAQMDALLADAGFGVEALYGWFDHRDFTEKSQEMVWIANRRST